MKSLFSQFGKMFQSSISCHLQRLAVVVMFLSFAAIATAASQAARFYIYDVQLKESTGSGKVYISDEADGLTIYTESGGSKKEFRLSYPDTLAISKYNTSGWGGGTANFHVCNTEISKNNVQTMAASLIATADPGSYFDGWTYDPVVLTVNSGDYHENLKNYTPPTTYTPTIENNKYKFSFNLGPFTSDMKVSLSQHTAIYAKFTAKTYFQKWPEIVIETIDKYGNSSTGGGSLTVALGKVNTTDIQAGTQGATTGPQTYNASIRPDYHFTQTADDNGKLGQASYTWTITPSPNSGYYVESLICNSTDIPQSGGTFSNTTSAMSADASTPDVITVRFKQNFTANYTGPKLAFASNSADNGNISVGGQTITKTTEKIDLSTSGGSVTNKLNYQYTYTAENTNEATFVGWTLNADGTNILSSDLSYTHTFTIDNIDALYQTPTMYAVYESFYYKMPTLRFATGAYGLGYIATSSDGNRPTESDDWLPIDITETDVIQVATGGQDKKKIYYYYHAMPSENSKFVCFSSDAEGTSTLHSEVDYTREIEISSKDINNPTPCDFDVFAVFQKNTFYFYKGAVYGFTQNGEKGTITLTSQYYNTATEGETLKTFTASSSDAAIDDSDKTYNTALNNPEYTYTYTAENTDPNTTFKGWSRSPYGGNIISPSAPANGVYTYSSTYSTSATTSSGENVMSPPTLYAVFQSFWYKDPTVLLTTSSAGAGQVAAVYSENQPDDSDWEWKDQILASDQLHQVPAEVEEYNYTIWYKANPKFGAYFAGWANANAPNQLITQEGEEIPNPYKVNYTVTNTDDTAPFVPARLYAVFKSVIEVIQQDRMIYHVDDNGNKNINDANVIINFNKADILTATLKDKHDIFQISDKQKVASGTTLQLDATSGIMQLVLSYTGNTPEEHIGETATITLSAQYTEENGTTGTTSIDVQITIEERPYVAFLPTDGKGSYTIKHTDGRGIGYTMPINATENINVSLSQENMATFELCLTEDLANDGLTFAGWQMIVDNVPTYFSYEPTCTYTFKESVAVRPVFLADNRAVFTIIGDEWNRKYFDLQLAIDDAQQRVADGYGRQVVVFSNEGKTEGVLQQGNYTIPNEVILLIPGVGPGDDIQMINESDEDLYIYRLRRDSTIGGMPDASQIVLSDADYFTDGASATAKAYRKLIVEDNTTITVEAGANLNLYAVLNRSGQAYDGRPYRYGQLVLGENCQINIENDAALYALGFITGAYSSRVIAKPGSEVHEVFQYSDPRGGTGVAHLYLNRDYYKVFPFSQYYIQNIEIPMEIQAGATEYVTVTADVLQPYVLMSAFVISDSESTDASGLFRLGSNTSLIKYYDPVMDRQKYIFKGHDADSYATLGHLEVRMGDLTEQLGNIIDGIVSGLGGIGGAAAAALLGLNDVKLNSRDYVLPINNNMDVSLESSILNIQNSFAFLAGSTLTCDENSTINITNGANIYVYDADENLLPIDMRTGTNFGKNTGYFSNENYPLKIISATPNNSHLVPNSTTGKRSAAQITDAKWIINGTVNVAESAGFYTTNGGAQIISTNRGKVVFNADINSGNTYQAKYISNNPTGLVDISIFYPFVTPKKEGVHNRASYLITSAKLQNANVKEYVTTNQNTYTYDPALGKWITSGTSETLSGAQIRVTMPDYDLTTSDIDPLRTNILSSLFNISSATISWNGQAATDILGITASAAGTTLPIAYTPTNRSGEYVGLIRANGTETYYHRVNVTEDYTPHFTTIESVVTSAYLGYSSETSADITPEENNVAGIVSGTFASVWTAAITGEHADEFKLLWGEGANKLSDAKIVFRPKTTGSKTALLSLTCTYTDAAEVAHTTTVSIPLSASAQGLTANTLAFADNIDALFINSPATTLFQTINNTTQPINIELSASNVLTIAGENDNATIQPQSGSAGRTVTITATQAADLTHGIAAAEITKTITITEDIVWNWKHLYFGTENTNPVSFNSNVTINSIEIAESIKYTDEDGNTVEDNGDRHDVVVAFEKDGATYNNKVSIAGWETGETEVWFTVNYTIGGTTDTLNFESEVYRDPRHLPINVNDIRIYEAVTWVQNKTIYDNAIITFNSTEYEVAQWTVMFQGIPDLLTFNASGDNNWQIEESSNGTNWTIAYTWASISSAEPFELVLHPSTRFVRISYGTENVTSIGQLSNVAISELKTVRADVEKLYMPTPSSTKNVVFTYVSESGFDLTTTHEGIFAPDPAVLKGLNKDPFYVVNRVSVTSTAETEILGALNVKDTETSIPIQTFTSPQAIPIQLASDHEERYYYVASESYNTTWNKDERKVLMQNAVADADPYVVFHFAETPAPGIISFNYSASAQGSWVIDESADGTAWNNTMSVNLAEDASNQFVMRDFGTPETSRYVRVKYVSDYAEVVELTNLAILPTTNVTVNPAELIVYDTKNEKISVTANNLKQVTFAITPATDPASFQIVNATGTKLTADDLTSLFIKEEGGSISADIYIKYSGTALATYGELEISTSQDAQGTDIEKKVLATVKLTGLKNTLPIGETGLYTGTELEIANFDKTKEAKHRKVNTSNAFVNNDALFDYVIIYGETKTMDESDKITAPTSTAGSNALTPCYIYQKNGNNYELQRVVENANSSSKSWNGAITTNDNSLKVYITGFCPYASTGYSKSDEGVWYFQGGAGDKIDIYLEDCYIYSRYKSKRGNSFTRSNGESYSDKVARGSGAVLLFANTNDEDAQTTSMDVTIHTRDTNVLKSHYGCLFESIVGRAFQISSPIQIYMQSEAHYNNSYSTLTFDDLWPTTADHSNSARTNGFLSLQKQVNNAPSVDMGNAKTVVNFNGGQVELQNACNSSDNYESTLAISYRTGVYGPAKFRFVLSRGIGTEGVDGVVNFKDGTTTVQEMTVPERYRQYYLMDENGTTTSCLRSQKNTYVYGGSHCMMRACSDPTSKGGAPRNKPSSEEGSKLLGLYKYPKNPASGHKGGWSAGDNGLVIPIASQVPDGYNVNSVTPNNNATPDNADDDYLNFWVTDDYDDSVIPEVDQKISYWKACMTYIEAKYGIYPPGKIGGDTEIAFQGDLQSEEVYNLVYCQIDEDIKNVIMGKGENQYYAPVLNPAPTDNPEEKYLTIAPTQVGKDPNNPEIYNYITNSGDYQVENKVYYIVPAKADVWMTFTAPFDVKHLYIMETRHEEDLDTDARALMAASTGDENLGYRAAMLKAQAKHNADFAAFFGVALALESKKPFEDIFNDYIGWAKLQDGGTQRRDKYLLRHYNKVKFDWSNSDYYLYKNAGNWTHNGDAYETQWEFVTDEDVLMEQGETYSMLFPYCTGCFDEETGERDFWDYWTGKFLIFESTDGSTAGAHTIKGADFAGSKLVEGEWQLNETDKSLIDSIANKELNTDDVVVSGNSTFAPMMTENDNVFAYFSSPNLSGYMLNGVVEPTNSFLYTTISTLSGEVSMITRDGMIVYNNPGNDTPTGNIPTIAGNSTMFITAINGGINIAISEPQYVRVVSATGAMLYSGYVTTSVDVNLMTSGIYVVAGENEIQKIKY